MAEALLADRREVEAQAMIALARIAELVEAVRDRMGRTPHRLDPDLVVSLHRQADTLLILATSRP